MTEHITILITSFVFKNSFCHAEIITLDLKEQLSIYASHTFMSIWYESKIKVRKNQIM